MPINNFCKNCSHRLIPDSMKQKFNDEVKLMFLECPMKDPHVIGCYMKGLVISWKSFSTWLDDCGNLDETEAEIIKKLKLK